MLSVHMGHSTCDGCGRPATVPLRSIRWDMDISTRKARAKLLTDHGWSCEHDRLMCPQCLTGEAPAPPEIRELVPLRGYKDIRDITVDILKEVSEPMTSSMIHEVMEKRGRTMTISNLPTYLMRMREEGIIKNISKDRPFRYILRRYDGGTSEDTQIQHHEQEAAAVQRSQEACGQREQIRSQ